MNEVKLPPRLQAVAAFIPRGAVVADIGTDHALLPLYLVQEGIARRVIATEAYSGPWQRAVENIAKAGLAEKIELRQGDGLAPLAPGEAEVAVLAGMGGSTICEILAARPQVAASFVRLVLQPMAAAGKLRCWLVRRGWRIAAEDLVAEGRRLYQVVVAERGEEEETDPLAVAVGPRLLAARHPLLARYLRELLRREEEVIRGMLKAREKRPEIGEELKLKEERRRWLEEKLAKLAEEEKENEG